MDESKGDGSGGVEGSETLEGFRRRVGSLKRKNNSSSSGPSKRLAKDKAPLPPLHNGPAKTRQSPVKAASAHQKISGSNPLPPSSTSASPHKRREGYDAPLVSSAPQRPVQIAGGDTKQEEGVDQRVTAVVNLELSAEKLRDENAHIVPTPAGWFSWTKVHTLEKRGLSSFFNGKSTTRTPEMYLEMRNLIIKAYHSNPQKQIGLTDLSNLLSEDLDAGREIMEFLDHWGLINFRPFPTCPDDPVVDEASTPFTGNEAVETDEASIEAASLLEKLYHFEIIDAQSRMKPSGASASRALPAPVLTEAAVPDVLIRPQGPAVEYHCNSCSADCSRRRYHCQKQADFDLCSECFNDEKFGSGMAATDFILMEPVTETAGVSGGSWTDQETLLLLEALELYGDNWNEIAEHVATKSKAQCILHFIRLPIEDPFLEDKEMPDTNVHTSLETVAANKDSASAVPQSTSESPVAKSSSTEEQPGVPKNDDVKSKQAEEVEPAQKKVENDAIKAISAAFQALGALSGSEDSLSFAEAGNPVMALVAFLAAMVGTDLAAGSAQSALKTICEETPAIQLAARHCFLLEDPLNDSIDDIANVRAVAQKPENQDLPLEQPKGAEEDISKKEDVSAVSEASKEGDSLEAPAFQQESQVRSVSSNSATTSGENAGKDDPEQTCSASEKQCREGSSEVEDSNSLDKMKHAAVTALSGAAVKAKLLANQEEEHIRQLVAEVIDNQLKKLEIKLRHFRELEFMLRKEREQIQRAGERLLIERRHIVESRRGLPALLPRSGSLSSAIGNPSVGALGRFSPGGGSVHVTSANTMTTKPPGITSPKAHIRKAISSSVPKSMQASSSAPLSGAAAGSSSQTVAPREAVPSVRASQGFGFK